MDIDDKVDTSLSTDEIRISSKGYGKLRTEKDAVISLFEEIVTIHKGINKDIEWKGKPKEKYEEGKHFIDKFMNDFPDLFQVFNTEINEIEKY